MYKNKLKSLYKNICKKLLIYSIKNETGPLGFFVEYLWC